MDQSALEGEGPKKFIIIETIIIIRNDDNKLKK